MTQSVTDALAKLNAESQERAVAAAVAQSEAEARRVTAERKLRAERKRHRGQVADLEEQVLNLQRALAAAKRASTRYAPDHDPCQRALIELFGATWEAKQVGVPCLRTPWIPVETVMRWRSLVPDLGAL